MAGAGLGGVLNESDDVACWGKGVGVARGFGNDGYRKGQKG